MTEDQNKDQSQDRPFPYKAPEQKNSVLGNSPLLKRPVILGDLTLVSPTTQTTIGSNGAATALTANPVGYLTVMIGNTAYQIPYYNMA